MKEKNDCKIIQDLLPNYVEELTNEETNKFIQKHLEECNECKRILENMQKDLKLNTDNTGFIQILLFSIFFAFTLIPRPVRCFRLPCSFPLQRVLSCRAFPRYCSSGTASILWILYRDRAPKE